MTSEAGPGCCAKAGNRKHKKSQQVAKKVNLVIMLKKVDFISHYFYSSDFQAETLLNTSPNDLWRSFTQKFFFLHPFSYGCFSGNRLYKSIA
jgi:hypothetical protein